MNQGQELLDAGLRAHEDITGNMVVTYRGRDWPCLSSTLLRGTEMEIGGKYATIQRTITIRKSALPTATTDAREDTSDPTSDVTADSALMPPHPGKLVLFQGRKYQIASVDEDSVGAAWRCHLKSPDGGR